MKADLALANLDAYDIWAKDYPPVPHNPLMRAEQHAMQELWPEARHVEGARTLDLACGTGRYARLLQQGGAASVVAVDFSVAMLLRLEGESRVRGDMMSLPFAPGVFDIVVCGLAVGHAPQLDRWAAEIARVLVPGGVALYSDFHPDAARAGMTRSFTDSDHRRHTLHHRCYALVDHVRAAQAAGMHIEATREVRVGFQLQEGFAGAEAFYTRWHGLPVVLALRARKAVDA